MKKVLCFALIVLFTNPFISFSQETSSDTELEDFAGLYAECAAYYRLASLARNSTDPKTAESYRHLEKTAMFYSLLLAIDGGRQDAAVAATHSRSEMYLQRMQHEAEGKNENVASIIHKYDFMCRDAMENPPDQLVQTLMTMLQE